MKILITIFFIILFVPFIVFAAGTDAGGNSDTGNTVTLTDPLGIGNSASGPQQLIGKIIKAVLGLVGSLALAMFIYGGFTWMLAAGNPRQQQYA